MSFFGRRKHNKRICKTDKPLLNQSQHTNLLSAWTSNAAESHRCKQPRESSSDRRLTLTFKPCSWPHLLMLAVHLLLQVVDLVPQTKVFYGECVVLFTQLLVLCLQLLTHTHDGVTPWLRWHAVVSPQLTYKQPKAHYFKSTLRRLKAAAYMVG